MDLDKGTNVGNVFNCTIMSTFIRKREVKANTLKIEQINFSLQENGQFDLKNCDSEIIPIT